TLCLEQGIACNHAAQFRRSPGDNRYSEPKHLGNPFLDSFGYLKLGALASLENHVAALNISLNPLEPKRFKQFPECGHLDLVVPANVDAAQHGDVDGHGYIDTRTTACSETLQATSSTDV